MTGIEKGDALREADPDRFPAAVNEARGGRVYRELGPPGPVGGRADLQ
jgi:hypothetical protein